ncbi:MAG: hypothetical protein Q8O30_12790 [Candidatus Omnitrophota bacterium]|nr:hypothetical protein [Candidatus Omnitrophota bacterium]
MKRENTVAKNQKPDSKKMDPEEKKVLSKYAVWHLGEQSKELCSVCSDNCHCNAHCH